jgi:hypothetical protein
MQQDGSAGRKRWTVGVAGLVLAALRHDIGMNGTLLKALAISTPAVVVFTGALAVFSRERNFHALLQLAASVFLVVAVLTHFAEGLQLFPSMRWGADHSVGHYLDFWSAVLGLTLFPAGYLLQALVRKR